MARNFDATEQFISIADDAALTLGDDVTGSGPWAIAFWFRCAGMFDSTYHVLWSWAGDVLNSANVYLYGFSHPTLAGKIRIRFYPPAGDTVSVYFTDVISDNAWHHLALSYDGTTVSAWLDGASQFAIAKDLDAIDVAGPLLIGKFSTTGNRDFEGDIAEMAKWDAALSSEQRTALLNGVCPPEIGSRPTWYLPLLAGLEEEVAAIAVTNSGSTIAEHPPKIICPGIPHVLRAAWPTITGPYQVSAAATASSGTIAGRVFSTGTMIGQVNEQ